MLMFPKLSRVMVGMKFFANPVRTLSTVVSFCQGAVPDDRSEPCIR